MYSSNTYTYYKQHNKVMNVGLHAPTSIFPHIFDIMIVTYCHFLLIPMPHSEKSLPLSHPEEKS